MWDQFKTGYDLTLRMLGALKTKFVGNPADGVKESINELKTMISDSLTDERDMSKADTAFATSLLSGLLISWHKTDPNMNVVADSAVGVFEWSRN